MGEVAADGGHVQAGMAGVEGAPGFEELVAGNEHRVQHGLPEQEVAHPLRHDDVHLLGQLHRLDRASLVFFLFPAQIFWEGLRYKCCPFLTGAGHLLCPSTTSKPSLKGELICTENRTQGASGKKRRSNFQACQLLSERKSQFLH